jgi:hypothetical protein
MNHGAPAGGRSPATPPPGGRWSRRSTSSATPCSSRPARRPSARTARS